MPATEMSTAEVPKVYQRLANAIGAAHWQGAVERQEDAIRSNHFLRCSCRLKFDPACRLNIDPGLVAAF